MRKKYTRKKITLSKRTKKILLITILLVIIAVLTYFYVKKESFLGINNNYEVVETDNFDVNTIAEGYTDLPDNYNYDIYTHDYYTCAYSNKKLCTYWVSYILTNEMVWVNNVSRDNESFIPDPQLTGDRAVTYDYSNSNFDRGHLCPAADMNFNQTAMTQTFYLTNILPQIPEFNRGIWKELEEKVRDWAIDNDSLYVVVGAIFPDNPKKIGENKIPIPIKFYKVIADISDKDGYKAIAFLFENKEYPKNESFMKYSLSIDDLESRTGIDFFANYHNKDAELVEKSLNRNFWE